jgi:hypothetical protein
MNVKGTKGKFALLSVLFTRNSLYALLCDEWYNTAVYPGDIVRIVQIDSNNVFQSFPSKIAALIQLFYHHIDIL